MKSTARENYLKTILELQESNDNEVVSLNPIANEPRLAARSVLLKCLSILTYLG